MGPGGETTPAGEGRGDGHGEGDRAWFIGEESRVREGGEFEVVVFRPVDEMEGGACWTLMFGSEVEIK